jgi:hypothetical protein
VTIREKCEEAFDKHEEGQEEIRVKDGEIEASFKVSAVGPVGVRLKEIEIRREGGLDVVEEAERLSRAVRSLGDKLHPIEVDPGLGGAILRSRPDESRPDESRAIEFFEMDCEQGGKTRLRRLRVLEEGGREAIDFSMTRDQLGRLVEEVTERE